ncbi:beta strand repeat-containing protein, partial [Flavobacterium luteum]
MKNFTLNTKDTNTIFNTKNIALNSLEYKKKTSFSIQKKGFELLRLVFAFLTVMFLGTFSVRGQYTTPTINAVIGASEYGTHTDGSNQNTNSAVVSYMTWDATNLYFAVSGSNVSEAIVLYLDKDPQNPVNSGANSNGTNVGYNSYDGTNYAELPFRADLVIYAKSGYREYRTANGSNGWSAQTTAFGSYADGSGVQEFLIPWSVIGGIPSSFNFFSYKAYTNGIYNQQPTANPTGSIGTSARNERYYTVSSTGNGSSTKPFSRECVYTNQTGTSTFSGTGTFYDFTVNQNLTVNVGSSFTVSNQLFVGSGSTFAMPSSGGQKTITFGSVSGNTPSLVCNGTITPNNGSGNDLICTFAQGTSTLSGSASDANFRLFDINVSNGATLQAPSSGTVTLGIQFGTMTVSGTGIVNFKNGSGVVNANVVSNGTNNYNFSNTSGTVTFNNLTISSGATFRPITSGTHFINIGGNLVNTGTYSTSNTTGILHTTFNGGVAQAISASTTFQNVTVTNASTAVTLGGNSVINGTLTVNAAASLNLSTFTLGSPTALTMQIGSTGASISGSGLLTLGGDITVTAPSGNNGATISCPVALGATRTFTVADEGTAAADLTVSGIISGSTFGITKAGAGKLTVSGNNTFTGITTLNAGNITVSNTAGLGAAAQSVVLNAGVLDLATDTTVNAYNVTVGGNATILSNRATSGAGISQVLGTLSIGASTLTTGNGGNATSGNPVVRFGNVTHTGAPTYTVSNSSAVLTLGAVANSTFLTTFNGSGSVTQTGVFGGGTGGITYSGSGTLVLNQANTYIGATSISSGTIRLGAASSFPSSSALTVNTPGTFNLFNFSATAASLAGSGTVSSTGSSTTPVLTVGDTTSTTFSGVIQNGTTTSVGLTKVGTGTLTVSGTNNTYTGATTITTGTLLVNGSLASGSAVSVTSNGTLGGNGTAGGTVALTAGTVAPGNAPSTVGNLSTGAFTFDTNSKYTFDITNVAGNAGTNWDLLTSSGVIDIAATSGSPIVINLSGNNSTGFSSCTSYTWKIAGGSSITNFAANKFIVNTASFAPSFTGTFSVSNTVNDINLVYTAASPTITLGSNPSVCLGTTSANLSYSATTNSPNQYSIDYDATANTALFSDVSNVSLPSTPIVLTVPGGAAAATYNATLTVTNNTTGCISGSYAITIAVTSCSNTITTDTSIAGPFCAGASVSVPFTISGTFVSGNIFTAQLSNSSGSFTSPTAIGTLTQTTAGTISATIPPGATTGSLYRIRVVSDNPSINGADNGTDLTVNATVTINAFSSTTSTRCQGAGTVTTTTTANNSTGITYSLDATTAAFSGNSINSSTGAVTYAAGWS